VQISSCTTISHSIRKPGTYTGLYPSSDNASWARYTAWVRHLDRPRRPGAHAREGEEEMTEMDIFEVLKNLPQRYPILMIDRVKHCEANKRIVALKNVSANEPYFQGHFPGRPIMPGRHDPRSDGPGGGRAHHQRDKGTDHHQNIYYYVGIDDARFKKPVIPGDQLELDVKVERMLRGIGKFSCVARVGTEVAAEATILLAMRPAEP
jgi:3-hydroxyacyl-[acyl-carrier-protein] dehydratase